MQTFLSLTSIRFHSFHASTTGVTWGSLFLLQGELYLIGNDPKTRSIIITSSKDRGHTWSKIVTLYDDSHYHGSATSIVIKNGFLYRAFEDLDQEYASLVIAGDTSRDLLDPSAWRMSNKVKPPRVTPSLSRQATFNGNGSGSITNRFLEGNVVDIQGQLHVLLRTRIDAQLTTGMTSVCRLVDNGKQMAYQFVQFHPMQFKATKHQWMKISVLHTVDDVKVKLDKESGVLRIRILAKDGQVAWSDIMRALLRTGQLDA